MMSQEATVARREVKNIRRSRVEILMEILGVIEKEGPVRLTPSLYKANMSYVMTEKLLSELLAYGFIRKESWFYSLTGSGRKFYETATWLEIRSVFYVEPQAPVPEEDAGVSAS
jgi:predicted transcriptional regulator